MLFHILISSFLSTFSVGANPCTNPDRLLHGTGRWLHNGFRTKDVLA